MLSTLASASNDSLSDPDIEITCNGYKWKCHKLVLRKASEWFQRAIAGNFKEGTSPIIDLQGELPDSEDAIEAMLKFCYSLDYNDKNQTEPATFNVRIFALAEKYLIKGLDWHSTNPKRLLRDTIVKYLSEQDDFLANFGGEKQEYRQLMEDIPRFAADITRVLAK
ncbi:hypothetical protein DOTSEDRAFT_27591 [Dothistroma septosporum NZE10]|uniref:BTB domain-containing protein n=1 Tax=Dothistroma septosporum (strain NZE10 / CBS 128990) TaxID=675120 RepID=N1PEF0_DOTSN|nr:hypothetical protein DOTSEDRAFT_27591 [Dothistroma septosporum NZE10]